MERMSDTCDECANYRIWTGKCKKKNIERRSCGEQACDEFVLAKDIASERAKEGEG